MTDLIAAGRIPVVSTVAPDADGRRAQPQRRHGGRRAGGRARRPQAGGAHRRRRAVPRLARHRRRWSSQIGADELDGLLPRLRSRAWCRRWRPACGRCAAGCRRRTSSTAGCRTRCCWRSSPTKGSARWSTMDDPHERAQRRGGRPSMMDNYGTPTLGSGPRRGRRGLGRATASPMWTCSAGSRSTCWATPTRPSSPR